MLGIKGQGGHWEGLSPQKTNDVRRRRVESWGLRQRWRTDLTDGVWRVKVDCTGEGPGELKVRCGHFVRYTEDNLRPRPGRTGSSYVRLCSLNSEADFGWVEDWKLERVVEIANGEDEVCSRSASPFFQAGWRREAWFYF